MVYNKMTDECVICLDMLNTNKTRYIKCCNNIIHDECLKKWLYKNNRCPLCNQDICIKYSWYEYFICYKHNYLYS